jgi:hypothetical protein
MVPGQWDSRGKGGASIGGCLLTHNMYICPSPLLSRLKREGDQIYAAGKQRKSCCTDGHTESHDDDIMSHLWTSEKSARSFVRLRGGTAKQVSNAVATPAVPTADLELPRVQRSRRGDRVISRYSISSSTNRLRPIYSILITVTPRFEISSVKFDQTW